MNALTLITTCSLLLTSSVLNFVSGRLTEVTTNRLPVLAHNLHAANIDLKYLSRRANLGPRSELKYKTGEFVPTAKGSQRVRLIQTYADYEVFGPVAVAEVDSKGHFTGHLYGDVARNLHKDIPNPESCVRDVNVLLNISIRLEKLRPDDANIDQKDGRRAIYADPEVRRARIIYVVEFFYQRDNYVSLPVYYFEACSNRVLFSYNKIQNSTRSQGFRDGVRGMSMEKESKYVGLDSFDVRTNKTRVKSNTVCIPSVAGEGGNPNTGRIVYDTPPYCLPVSTLGFSCAMQGNFVTVVDNQNSEQRDKLTPVVFTCLDGYSDPTNGAYGVANDALFYGEIVGRFFLDVFNTNPLPFLPRIVVHYGRNYENAFWWEKTIYLGDGQNKFYPLSFLDIIAHEYAHGITIRTSDLVYRAQPGGISEAFSDITGAAAMYYMTDRNHWRVAAALLKSGTGALRYMDNPGIDGRSISNIWRYVPFMDVHHSSGVFNYAFYRMVVTYDMDMFDAYAAVFNANRLLWGRFTRFRKGACNVMQASYDAGSDHKAVQKAFQQTRIPLLLCNHKALKTTLFPGETKHGVLVSNSRSPVLEIDMSHFPGSGIKASAFYASRRKNVQISVASDGDANDVIATGVNRVTFPGNRSVVYVKLMSTHLEDLPVSVTVFG